MDHSQDNPLREGLRLEAAAEPCIVVIFGASGDLTSRKLVPALYRLTQERLLPAEFAIVGFSRSPMSHEAFRDKMKKAVETFSDGRTIDPAVWESFAQGIFYTAGDINDPEAYRRMSELLDQIDRERVDGRQPDLLPLRDADSLWRSDPPNQGRRSRSAQGRSLDSRSDREAVWS